MKRTKPKAPQPVKVATKQLDKTIDLPKARPIMSVDNDKRESRLFATFATKPRLASVAVDNVAVQTAVAVEEFNAAAPDRQVAYDQFLPLVLEVVQ